MKKHFLNLAFALLLGLSLSIFSSSTSENHIPNQSTKMNSYLSIFEIPSTDYTRAVSFYEKVMDINIETIDMQGTTMGLFPAEGQSVFGAVVKGEGYEPSATGTLIYLNGGENLQVMLDRVVANGGEVVMPKTLIDEENGYFAMFLDTEGNRLGLHSPN